MTIGDNNFINFKSVLRLLEPITDLRSELLSHMRVVTDAIEGRITNSTKNTCKTNSKFTTEAIIHNWKIMKCWVYSIVTHDKIIYLSWVFHWFILTFKTKTPTLICVYNGYI